MSFLTKIRTCHHYRLSRQSCIYVEENDIVEVSAFMARASKIFLILFDLQFLNVASFNQSKSYNHFPCLIRTNYDNIRYRRLYIGFIKLFCKTVTLLKLLDKIVLIYQVGQSTTCHLAPFVKASSRKSNYFSFLSSLYIASASGFSWASQLLFGIALYFLSWLNVLTLVYSRTKARKKVVFDSVRISYSIKDLRSACWSHRITSLQVSGGQ